MSVTEPLTRKRLKELLDYNPETGIFVWRYRPEGPANWNAQWAGKEAGYVINQYRGTQGYILIGISYKRYLAHRLAFLYMKGYWPDEIDHINGVGTDNRWKNLSNCTPVDNQGNRALNSNSPTGVSGVHWCTKAGKYKVHIAKKGKQYHGGYFTSKTEAAKKARELYHELGFHENHGLTREERSSS